MSQSMIGCSTVFSSFQRVVRVNINRSICFKGEIAHKNADTELPCITVEAVQKVQQLSYLGGAFIRVAHSRLQFLQVTAASCHQNDIEFRRGAADDVRLQLLPERSPNRNTVGCAIEPRNASAIPPAISPPR